MEEEEEEEEDEAILETCIEVSYTPTRSPRQIAANFICKSNKLHSPLSGLDWLGLAWSGLAWTGLAWPGLAWTGPPWPGTPTAGTLWGPLGHMAGQLGTDWALKAD